MSGRRGSGSLAPLLAAGVLVGPVVSGNAWAQSTSSSGRDPFVRPGSLLDYAERRSGMLELGVGWLTLPRSTICVQRSSAGCRRGDSSLEAEAWQLFRIHRNVALGAGAALGLVPTTGAPRHDPEGITRDHSRSYLTLEATGRYYPYVQESVEAWGGATAGLAVVSDRFVVDTYNPMPLIGPAGSTIQSEGLSLGLAGGAAYGFAPGWSIGGSLRLGAWLLPKQPGTNALGDEASLVGANAYLALAISVAYRVRL